MMFLSHEHLEVASVQSHFIEIDNIIHHSPSIKITLGRVTWDNFLITQGKDKVINRKFNQSKDKVTNCKFNQSKDKVTQDKLP